MTMILHNVTASIAAGISTETPSTPQTASPATQGASLLPEPAVMLDGDPGAEIAALAVQQGETQQNIDTVSTEQQDTVENQEDAAQVATLHDEASTMRAGAWESGLLQVSAGACAIGSAGASIGAAQGSTRAGVSGILKGTSEGLMGGGSLADGLSKAAATDTQALATGQKALSDAAQRAGDMDRDAQKSASAFVQSALDFYREYETAKRQAQAAAVHAA
jgi:hypothetical protein